MTSITSPAKLSRTRACAHRGDSSRHRENTLPSVSSAIEAGAEFVEIDVRLSRDGAVVVLHDPTLLRLWGVASAVGDMTWSELQALGSEEHRLALLTEVIELFRDSASTLVIDMETAEPAVAAHEIAAASGVPIVWCGDLLAMREIRSLDAGARIWMPWNELHSPTAKDIDGLSPEYINSNFHYITEELVRDIHALGYLVSTWTLDIEATIRWAIKMGVDSVTTNQLELLQQIIAEETRGEVDLDAAIVIARELAQWAIDFATSSDPGLITTKTNAADLVTEVDVAIEEHVREIIGQRFAEHGFVGEELGGSAQAGVPCWYLDPVDGTTNFANRIPWNAFSLALVLDETPLVAVVADPWRGELFEAVRGRGAKLNGSPLQIPHLESSSDPLSGHVVSTELAAHLAWPGMLEMLHLLGQRHCTMRIMGSGTMTLVGVAAGRGVGSVIGQFGPVDHLAAALIVQESGGVVLDSAGQPNLFPRSGGIMAAAPQAATALYHLWVEACASAIHISQAN